jgi:hypothetical protein
MAPLDNLQHEKFAQNLIESKSQLEAYQKTFPGIDANSASASASRLLTLESVKQRVLELMNVKVSPDSVVNALADCIASENEGVKLNAVNTALKAYHVFDEDKQTLSIDTVNIVFGDVTAPKAPDEK